MYLPAFITVTLAAFAAFSMALPAAAQGIGAVGVGPGPKLGEMEVKAYEKIPKTKVAVQLTSDSHLARELRRRVMERLQQRGNQVGFSGGNVMRMDISFYDLLGGGSAGRDFGTIGGQPYYASPGANPRMDLPANPVSRRDGPTPTTAGPTLRITLTLYSVDNGRVLWMASGSCKALNDSAQRAGEAMINRIFDAADKSGIADAGCPL